MDQLFQIYKWECDLVDFTVGYLTSIKVVSIFSIGLPQTNEYQLKYYNLSTGLRPSFF